MSEVIAARRRRTLAGLAGAALVSVLAAWVSLRPLSNPQLRAEIGELVAPTLEEEQSGLGLLMVTTQEETYHLVRNPDGWVLTEKGGYPVKAEKIGQFAQALQSLRYQRAMTRDPRKFDRIGLGDPLTGGAGALVEVGDGRGNVTFKAILGYRSGQWYVRFPDDLQAWAVSGEDLPPLQRGARWLDLDFDDITEASVTRVSVAMAGQRPYEVVAPNSSGGDWTLAPPNDVLRVLSTFTLSITGRAAISLAPLDVAPSQTLSDAVMVGMHTSHLREGVAVDVRCYRRNQRGWVTLVARLENGTLAARRLTDEINAKAQGWAYALSDNDFDAFLVPLDTIAVRRVGVPD